MTKKPLRILLLVVLLFAFASASQNVGSGFCDTVNQQPAHNHLLTASGDDAATGSPLNNVPATNSVTCYVTDSGLDSVPTNNYLAQLIIYLTIVLT